MCDTDKKFILLCTGALMTSENKKGEKRKWVKEWLQDRNKYSERFLVTKLKSTEPEDYKHFLRMSDVQFDTLLKLVQTKISKQDTVMRSAISVEERLILTLRYLATGIDYSDLQYCSRISVSSISKIVPETCRAIYQALRDYIKLSTLL